METSSSKKKMAPFNFFGATEVDFSFQPQPAGHLQNKNLNERRAPARNSSLYSQPNTSLSTPITNPTSYSPSPSPEPRFPNLEFNFEKLRIKESPAPPKAAIPTTHIEVPSTSSSDSEESPSGSEDSSSDDEPDPVHDQQTRSSPRMEAQLALLRSKPGLHESNELLTAPIFTEAVRSHMKRVRKHSKKHAGGKVPEIFTQYGLLAGISSEDVDHKDDKITTKTDPRIYMNTAAPSSVFICGSQGSGKSHTLSCLLENCLMPSAAAELPRPLTGVVFHYDTFISDAGGSPCEVAYLASSKNIKIRVLCAPTNVATIRRIYSRFPRVTVEELRLNQADLNTKRMMDLMAASSGSMPLYLHVVNRILRDMRVEQQRTGRSFDYTTFKQRIMAEQLTDAQSGPLKQRLDTLESFMVEAHASASIPGRKAPPKKSGKADMGNDWTPTAGRLTIVDLSCPCVTAEMACLLFNISLSLFLEQDSTKIGRVVALDEAHKYMTDPDSALVLTDALLSTIRLQRHLGARVFISTQEPTISPKLLDLCSVTIVHRFTSPDWLGSLKQHLAGVSSASKFLQRVARYEGGEEDGDGLDLVDGLSALTLDAENPALALFSRIVALGVGEALLFAPSAMLGVVSKAGEDPAKARLVRLGHGVLQVRIRNRLTADGGRSILAQ